MVIYLCSKCRKDFDSEAEAISHESLPIKGTGYNGLTLKEKESGKYELFLLDMINDKHEATYKAVEIYKNGSLRKEVGDTYSPEEIKYEMERENRIALSEKELSELEKALREEDSKPTGEFRFLWQYFESLKTS
jgi:hypothetical protein